MKQKEDIHKRKNKKRKIKIIRVIGAILFVLLLFATLYPKFYKFSSYTLRKDIEISKTKTSFYKEFEDNIVKYSTDGCIYMDYLGQQMWNITYEMAKPIIDINDNYFVIADQNSDKIKLFDKTGEIANIKTTLPISKVRVSAKGLIVCVMEDKVSSYIDFYSVDGKKLDIEIKQTIDKSGYPIDISISDDGERLMVAYEYIEVDKLKARVVFYDFSEKGKNIDNRIVAGFEEIFEDSVLAKVSFLDDKHSFALSSNSICFFNFKGSIPSEKPILHKIDGVIASLSYTNENISVIYKDKEKDNYTFLVFDKKGKLKTSQDFNYSYKYFDLVGDKIFLYTKDNLLLYDISGKKIYSGSIDFMPYLIKKPNLLSVYFGMYDFVTENSIKSIKFK